MSKTKVKKQVTYQLRLLQNVLLLDEAIENREFYSAMLNEIMRKIKEV